MASAQPPHGFLYLNHYGQGGGGTRSYYQGESIESSENQVKKENKTQPQEQDMEIGYEDNPLLQTFEGLDKKFLNEIMKLVKEQTDAEDAENVRHRETGTTSKECEVKQSRWKEEDAQHGQLIIWTETTSTRGNVVPPMLKTNFRLLIFKQWRSVIPILKRSFEFLQKICIFLAFEYNFLLYSVFN
ncbi:uncharacterized protein LOC110817208 isoform X1 [Carica papaya]|uniref:uncharacterized protein LOC110817208 isoform X1 n=1 Tax=Carica papaya TaxID=3649 RepID=UPI000B8CA15E|nr:uncharacterized protein LOC110817208 isoform X1 [Carica papaya]